MSLPGVQGVGISARDGQAGILILVDQQSRESEIPLTVGDMPVIVEEVGRIVAVQVMDLGESVGNDILCTGPCDSATCNFCSVGTTGFKVCEIPLRLWAVSSRTTMWPYQVARVCAQIMPR